MGKRLPLVDEAGEVRELTTEDLENFKPACEVLPASLQKKLGIRGPQKTPTKERVTIELSQYRRTVSCQWGRLANPHECGPGELAEGPPPSLTGAARHTTRSGLDCIRRCRI